MEKYGMVKEKKLIFVVKYYLKVNILKETSGMERQQNILLIIVIKYLKVII
jgi:hypothetical protein